MFVSILLWFVFGLHGWPAHVNRLHEAHWADLFTLIKLFND